MPHPRIISSNGARGRDQRKNRQDCKRKQRQSASEGIIKKVKGDDAERRLATETTATYGTGQTTEPVKGRPTMYQQVISIIGKLHHRILPAQVTSLSF